MPKLINNKNLSTQKKEKHKPTTQIDPLALHSVSEVKRLCEEDPEWHAAFNFLVEIGHFTRDDKTYAYGSDGCELLVAVGRIIKRKDDGDRKARHLFYQLQSLCSRSFTEVLERDIAYVKDDLHKPLRHAFMISEIMDFIEPALEEDCKTPSSSRKILPSQRVRPRSIAEEPNLGDTPRINPEAKLLVLECWKRGKTLQTLAIAIYKHLCDQDGLKTPQAELLKKYVISYLKEGGIAQIDLAKLQKFSSWMNSMLERDRQTGEKKP